MGNPLHKIPKSYFVKRPYLLLFTLREIPKFLFGA